MLLDQLEKSCVMEFIGVCMCVEGVAGRFFVKGYSISFPILLTQKWMNDSGFVVSVWGHLLNQS